MINYFVLERPMCSMCVCTLLADVASMEQQQSAGDSGKDQEEEEIEGTFMDMEEQEELTAVDTEQLKPEEIKSGATGSSGESCSGSGPLLSSRTERSCFSCTVV